MFFMISEKGVTGDHTKKEESSSFLKKRAKKLLLPGAGGVR
jgi:fucose 4-O-acetylase-like acetyltransferase